MFRLLLVADTHLGFDFPFRPRVTRRRRGPDFFTNFERALSPAIRGEVDLVVHSGDLLFRSKVPTALVEMAMAPLARVADAGVPVFLVPGNHERSRIPPVLWGTHPLIHIFDRPRTFTWKVGSTAVALAGFPFARRVRDVFGALLEETGHRRVPAQVRLLCIHQTVEGARVGPKGYTFRGGPDVVRGRDIPSGIAAVLAGHIHRAQVLRHGLEGKALPAPVLYPGSVERTAFAERTEDKGYLLLEIDEEAAVSKQLKRLTFVRLPARPMIQLEIQCPEGDPARQVAALCRRLGEMDPAAVVLVVLGGPGADRVRDQLPASRLRELAPATMNVELARPRTASP